jgi:hypothetical protein
MRKLLGIIFIAAFFTANAQVQTGSWRTHFSYKEGASVTIGQNKVWSVASGSLFTYDFDDNSLKTFSKIDGLSDIDIALVRYNTERDFLFIGYENGNIDILKGNTIENFQDIKMSSVTGSKRINNVTFHNNTIYISSDLGIVVFDADRKEVRETYILNSGTGQNPVNGVAIFEGFIYAATDKGLYKCNIDNRNLLNFANWQLETRIPDYDKKFYNTLVFNGRLLAVNVGVQNAQFHLYKLTSGVFSQVMFGYNYRSLKAAGNKLLLSAYLSVLLYDENLVVEKIINNYAFETIPYAGYEVMRSPDFDYIPEQGFAISDIIHGLVLVRPDETASIVTPDGPSRNSVWDFDISNGVVRVVPGVLTSSWNNTSTPPEVSVFKNNTWSVIERANTPGLTGAIDFVSIVSNPADAEHFYVASYNWGLYEFKGNQFVERYTDQNSSLTTITGLTNFYRINGLVFDINGTLWMNNHEVFNSLSALDANGEWHPINYAEIDNAGSDKRNSLGDIIVDPETNNKWMIVPRSNGGVFVFNENGTFGTKSDDKTKFLVLYDGQEDEVISNSVTCIARDKDGSMWVGSDNGIGIYYNPSKVFEQGDFNATRIRLPRINDEDNLADFLLDGERITSIAVDGGNRKWIGTANSGALLVSPDGLTIIHHFTEFDSPLPSNSITRIAIDDISGEVFIATAKGLVSFGGDASQGNDSFKNLKAFPNPVRENFTGVVTITGLVENTVVKITDISGNLVYETISNGGSVSWDRRNVFGSYVGTGVYLVYCATRDGAQSAMTKILIINTKEQ